MKVADMSVAALEDERRKTDEQILQLKKSRADEEGPLLAALRVRRSEIIAALARQPLALVAA